MNNAQFYCLLVLFSVSTALAILEAIGRWVVSYRTVQEKKSDTRPFWPCSDVVHMTGLRWLPPVAGPQAGKLL